MIMTSNDFVQTYNLKNKETSNERIQRDLFSIGLDNINSYLTDRTFSSDIGIVNIHLSKGTHWVAFINQSYVDSYGCVPPKKLSKFIMNRNGHCLYSEYKIKGLTRKRDSYCASCCFYISYLI